MKKLEINPKAEALIFDLDGTLADTMPVHFWAYKNILVEYGIDFTPELFAESPNRMQLLHQSYLAFFLSVDTKRIFHENKLSKNIEVRHSFGK